MMAQDIKVEASVSSITEPFCEEDRNLKEEKCSVYDASDEEWLPGRPNLNVGIYKRQSSLHKSPRNKSYSVSLKLEAINFAEVHTKNAAAKKYGVDPKQIREWIKKKEILRSCNPERKKLEGGGRKRTNVKKQETLSTESPNAEVYCSGDGSTHNEGNIDYSFAKQTSNAPGLLEYKPDLSVCLKLENSTQDFEQKKGNKAKEDSDSDQSMEGEELISDTDICDTDEENECDITEDSDSYRKVKMPLCEKDNGKEHNPKSLGRKHRSYPVMFKLKVILFVMHRSIRGAVHHFGIDRKQVKDWYTNREKLVQMAQEDRDRLKAKGCGRKPLCPEMEQDLLEWIKQESAKGTKVTRDMAQKQALEFFRMYKPDVQFTASKNWLKTFIIRHKLQQFE